MRHNESRSVRHHHNGRANNRFNSRTRSSNPAAIIGSSPAVGSSKNNNSGSHNDRGGASAASSHPAAELTREFDRAVRVIRPGRFWAADIPNPSALNSKCNAHETATRAFSARSFLELNRAPCWNITPKPPMQQASVRMCQLTTVCAQRTNRPRRRTSNPMISRSNVDFPQPLPPAMANTSPRTTVNSHPDARPPCRTRRDMADFDHEDANLRCCCEREALVHTHPQTFSSTGCSKMVSCEAAASKEPMRTLVVR